MEPDLVVQPGLTLRGEELGWRFSRSSGPGGQGVNTTDSRVELRWDAQRSPSLARMPGGVRDRALERLAPRLVDGVLSVTASRFRSQLRNRDAARTLLATLVRDAVAPPGPPRRPTAPSRAARARRVEAKRRRSAVKQGRRGQEW